MCNAPPADRETTDTATAMIPHIDIAAFSCSAATPDPGPPETTEEVGCCAMKAAMPGSCIAAGNPMPSIPPEESRRVRKAERG